MKEITNKVCRSPEAWKDPPIYKGKYYPDTGSYFFVWHNATDEVFFNKFFKMPFKGSENENWQKLKAEAEEKRRISKKQENLENLTTFVDSEGNFFETDTDDGKKLYQLQSCYIEAGVHEELTSKLEEAKQQYSELGRDSKKKTD
eukprot:GHVP01001848.1.p1 GENE.GHVP01001848.1~~GHVP01001848.1.p1  ORF type:complete len:145 (+),score=34.81 GHVP01001848.1:138-572(+)